MIKNLFKLSAEISAIIVAGFIYLLIAGIGIFGLYFTISHYHTSWKEIFLILISANLISVLGFYFQFALKEIKNLKSK